MVTMEWAVNDPFSQAAEFVFSCFTLFIEMLNKVIIFNGVSLWNIMVALILVGLAVGGFLHILK